LATVSTTNAAGAIRHVFLVRSSLQFLLASAMAEDLRSTTGGTSRLLFLPDVQDPALFMNAVQRWTDSPFDRLVLIAARRQAGALQAGRAAAAVRAELRHALADARPLSVTVFNDREEAGQTLLVEAARRFPQACRRCAEDGSRAYTGFTQRGLGWVGRWRQRLRVGRGWADVRVLGTHPLVQQFIALHPTLLRPELRDSRVRSLPGEALSAPAIRHLASALCSATGFDPATIPLDAALIAINHSGYMKRNPDYAHKLRECVAALHVAGTPLFVKYHPRESDADPLNLTGSGISREVPRTLPVECLYLPLRDRPLQVIGGMSTSLLTAALLMPLARVRVLQHASATGDAWDDALLRALKIETAA
jgi:hypothetical protein